MTDRRGRLTPRDRRSAQKWVTLMLCDPERHAQGLSNWIARKPARRTLFESVMGSVDQATAAGPLVNLPPPEPMSMFAKALKLPPAMAIAASVLVLAMISGMAMRFTDIAAPQFATSATARTMIMTKVGEVRTERLADGTLILLDTNTLASVELGPQTRIVELKRGRARFTVAQDGNRPFVVNVGRFQVAATGPVFDVSSRDGVAVQAIEGGLDVRVPSGADMRAIPVRFGEILRLMHGQTALPVATVARHSEQQWVDGVKSFDNVPVGEIIAEANSYNDTKLELADPSLGKREVFGDINVRDVEMVAEAIAGFLNLDIDRSHKNRLILMDPK